MINEFELMELSPETFEGLSVHFKRIKNQKGYLVLYVQGTIDAFTSKCWKKCIDKAIQAGYTRLIVDFSKYVYSDHGILEPLTYCLKAVREQGGDMAIVRVDPKVNEIWSLLGFSDFIKVKSTLEEALSSFGS